MTDETPNEQIGQTGDEYVSDEYLPCDGEVVCPKCSNNIFRLFFKNHPDKNSTMVFKCMYCKWQTDSKIQSEWKEVL
jgi:DNA-directed RNA polymerase subunit RPC12/RpoP